MIKKSFIIVVSCLFFLSCNKLKKESKKAPNELVLYQRTEMALLMQEMYDVMKKNKQLITTESSLDSMPKSFFKIYTAELTDPSVRDNQYKSFANIYLNSLNYLYNDTAPENLKTSYNNTISSCISCHQTICPGPISKIKKLFIP